MCNHLISLISWSEGAHHSWLNFWLESFSFHGLYPVNRCGIQLRKSKEYWKDYLVKTVLLLRHFFVFIQWLISSRQDIRFWIDELWAYLFILYRSIINICIVLFYIENEIIGWNSRKNHAESSCRRMIISKENI